MVEAEESNPLLSSQQSSQLQAVLHPLVLLTISDYITRHTLREQDGPVVGALLGQQNGREVTIEHGFEIHTREDKQTKGSYLLAESHFASRLEQMLTVHKERPLELVGWYTLLPHSGPTPSILAIHKHIIGKYNESAILLGFHPEEVLKHSVGGKLPLTIYESNYELDDPKANDEGGQDKMMDDAQENPLTLMFREVPYSVETDETEMISMNYIAAGAGAAVSSATASTTAKEDRLPAARSKEARAKGKRRLVETDGDDTDAKEPSIDESSDAFLTREEDEMVASLNTKVNAIKMLHARVRLIAKYLECLPQSYVQGGGGGGATAAANAYECMMETDRDSVPSLPILRQIQALVNRLDLVIPSNKEAYEAEVLHQTNTVNLIGLLNAVMQNVNEAREVGKKFSTIETSKVTRKRSHETGYLASPGFRTSGAGDILI